MSKKHFSFVCLATAAAAVFFSGCYSVPKEIPADATAQELIQLAQSSYDEGNTKAAQAYYEAVIIRYGDNMAMLIEAEYEIAHMKVKDRKWSQAVPDLQRILSYYEGDTAGTLPQEYRKLAQLDLAKAPEYALRQTEPAGPEEE